jgi:hypothetical protein
MDLCQGETMRFQHSHWKAERHIYPSMLIVEGRVIIPDYPVPGGYAVTTWARLRPIYSADPTILGLELVLDLDHRPTADLLHAQRARPVYYQEAPAPEASAAYTHVHVRYLGEILAEIPVCIRH